MQSKRDHCKKYSKKWKGYNRKLSSMKRKCVNQMKDFQHKISKQIIENTKANTIIVGDLKVKEMGNSESFHPEYDKYGSIWEVCESYNSQACCNCGMKHKRSLAERDIFCKCGNQMNRDLNSAVNIMKKYLYLKQNDSLLHQSPVNEEFFYASGTDSP